MTVTWKPEPFLAGAPLREHVKTYAEECFDTTASAFDALREFRLACMIRRLEAPGALARLSCAVRRDSVSGERVAVAAERYLAGTGTWWDVQSAFAEWANWRLVRVIDAAYPPENIPLEESELLGEVA
ncbi:hypothetical protein MOKP118_42890 [Mycobacterium avium subsp. hominissuis]